MTYEEKKIFVENRILWGSIGFLLMKHRVVIKGWPASLSGNKCLHKRKSEKYNLPDSKCILDPIFAWQTKGGYTDEKWDNLSAEEKRDLRPPLRVEPWSEGTYNDCPLR